MHMRMIILHIDVFLFIDNCKKRDLRYPCVATVTFLLSLLLALLVQIVNICIRYRSIGVRISQGMQMPGKDTVSVASMP